MDKGNLKSALLEALESSLALHFTLECPDNHLERPRDASHGDYASTIAMQWAKVLKRSPREIAQQIASIWCQDCSKWVTDASVAGPGFINLQLVSSHLQGLVHTITRMQGDYGRGVEGQDKKIMLEFVSANPTGPLHVGHGRQAALGDAIAKLLRFQGYDVWCEFYYNDAGVQIENLTRSVKARAQGIAPGDTKWPADGYRGDYILDIANKYLEEQGDISDQVALRNFAVAYLRHEQDRDLQFLGVEFDNFFLESSLYEDGSVADVVATLGKNGKTYHKDGALWLKTTEYGDDKDRVVQKSDQHYTYFVPDVAYHCTKWQRGFSRAVNIQGSDHYGTIARVRAGLQALDQGIPLEYPDYILHKMVTVMKSGAEVKISKRAGSYVTLRDLITWSGGVEQLEGTETTTEVIRKGRDAVRFFLLSRKVDTEFVFDIDLALSEGEDNPVYYVQYAHARSCALFKNWGGDIAELSAADTSLLISKEERALLSTLEDFPHLVKRAAQELAPHHLTFYARELASQFHRYYNSTRILVSPTGEKEARLALILAVRQVLFNVLCLLGVSAPQYL